MNKCQAVARKIKTTVLLLVQQKTTVTHTKELAKPKFQRNWLESYWNLLDPKRVNWQSLGVFHIEGAQIGRNPLSAFIPWAYFPLDTAEMPTLAPYVHVPRWPETVSAFDLGLNHWFLGAFVPIPRLLHSVLTFRFLLGTDTKSFKGVGRECAI